MSRWSVEQGRTWCRGAERTATWSSTPCGRHSAHGPPPSATVATHQRPDRCPCGRHDRSRRWCVLDRLDRSRAARPINGDADLDVRGRRAGLDRRCGFRLDRPRPRLAHAVWVNGGGCCWRSPRRSRGSGSFRFIKRSTARSDPWSMASACGIPGEIGWLSPSPPTPCWLSGRCSRLRRGLERGRPRLREARADARVPSRRRASPV